MHIEVQAFIRRVHFGTFIEASRMEENSTVKKDLCNGEVNGNTETNGGSSAKSELQIARARGKPRLGSVSLILSIARFLVECLFSYAVVLALLAPLVPLIVSYYILKMTERVIVKITTRGISLSGMDALWQQSTDKNRLVINGLVCAENNGSFEEGLKNFRQAIIERMVEAKRDDGQLLYPRARCYIQPGFFQYFFHEDKAFRIENHVFKWEGEVPCSKDELAAIVSKLSNEPFPEGRPPWYFCCVPTNFGDNDIAVVFRMSHSLADGVSLVRFLANKLPDQATPEKELPKFSANGRSLLLAKALLNLPRYLLQLVLGFADRSILHGPDISGVKTVTWHQEFEVQLIKQIKNATGTTVNDVLMSCLSLALRRYYQRKGMANPDDFTASVPVDVRSSTSRKLSLENKFSLIFPKLAVATEGVLEQLYEMKARMDECKVSGDPLGSAALISLSNELCPEFLISKINTFMTQKASCVLSNVPGPQHILKVKGCDVKCMIFWPPQKDNIGVGLSVFTYAGKVIVGVQGDVAVLSDPKIITEEFGNAVNEMAQCVLHTNGTVSNGHAAH